MSEKNKFKNILLHLVVFDFLPSRLRFIVPSFYYKSVCLSAFNIKLRNQYVIQIPCNSPRWMTCYCFKMARSLKYLKLLEVIYLYNHVSLLLALCVQILYFPQLNFWLAKVWQHSLLFYHIRRMCRNAHFLMKSLSRWYYYKVCYENEELKIFKPIFMSSVVWSSPEWECELASPLAFKGPIAATMFISRSEGIAWSFTGSLVCKNLLYLMYVTPFFRSPATAKTTCNQLFHNEMVVYTRSANN